MTAGNVYRTTAQVGPGHRIEIVAPEIAEGEQMEVILLPIRQAAERNAFTTVEALDLPVRDAAYWQARERELEASRNAWDR